MFITRKELNRMLQEERMKAQEQAQKEAWHRSQIANIHDEIIRRTLELNERIDMIQRKVDEIGECIGMEKR